MNNTLAANNTMPQKKRDKSVLLYAAAVLLLCLGTRNKDQENRDAVIAIQAHLKPLVQQAFEGVHQAGTRMKIGVSYTMSFTKVRHSPSVLLGLSF